MGNELLETLIINDFALGMVTNIDSPDKGITAFNELGNARIDQEEGSLVKRIQSAAYNATSLGSLPIKSGHRFYYGTSTRELIISYDTFLKKGNDATGTFSNIKTGLTSNKRFSFVPYKDKLYCFNGVDSNLRYDGTDVKNMGCDIPTSSPSAAEGTSGVLDAGTYQYLVTYLYDGYQESNPSTTATSVTITASKQVNLTSIPTASAGQGVTARKIYRTLKDGSVFYHLATISNNTTTTYTDNIADSGLTVLLVTNHDIPPIWSMAVLHKDRLFGFRPNSCELDFTSIEDFNSLPDIYDSVNNYIFVNENDGSDIVSIASLENGIIVYKRAGTFFVNTSGGNDPVQWTIERLDTRGTCAPNSVATTPKGIIALSLEKENDLDLRLYVSTGSLSLGSRVKDILKTINAAYFDEVVGFYHGGRYYLSFTASESGLSYNHKMLVLQFNDDFSKFGYTLDDVQLSCFVPAFGTADLGQIYAGMSSIGKMLRLETTAQDIQHVKLSEMLTGTLTRLISGGTEEYPEFIIDSTAFTGLFSNTVLDSLTATLNSYSTINDHLYNIGYITSEVLYMFADVLSAAAWTALVDETSGSAFRMRTADTAADCLTASWSAWFTNSTSSDISSVSAKDYVQYQLLLGCADIDDTTSKLYRDDFVVRISAGLGSVFETLINFVMDTGKIDFGVKDKIKRLRQIVVEYEAKDTTIRVYLAKNDESLSLIEAINTTTYPMIRQLLLPLNYIGEYFRIKIQESSLISVKIKSVRLRYSVMPQEAQILLRGR